MRAKWEKSYLELFRTNGNVSASARQMGLSRQAIYDRMESSVEFRQEHKEAEQEAADLLELEARRRAHDGVDEPVFYKGMECGTVRKYSDTLMMLLLRGAKPDKYKDRQEHSGPNGGPIVTKQYVSDLRDLSAEDLARLHSEEIGDSA